MNLTKSFFFAAAVILSYTSVFSTNISIIESQSVHPLHKMDENWQNKALELGYNATIYTQGFLDNISNLSNTDVLIISSGLIALPENRQQTIRDFVEQGGNLYIQSEYLIDLPGNQMFSALANNLGGNFSWEGEMAGGLTPMTISGELANNFFNTSALTYFWYGTYGSGSENVHAFLHYNNMDWGFIFCPEVPTYGKVITTSDQDWVRTLNSQELIGNIITYLVNQAPMPALPSLSIDVAEEGPCDDIIYTFTASTENMISGAGLQWTVNSVAVQGETNTTYVTSDLTDGDVVECVLSMNTYCASFSLTSNPILIAPINPFTFATLDITSNGDTFCENETVTFNATFSTDADASNIVYQWFINGLPVAGANAETFNTSNLSDLDVVNCTLTFDNFCYTGIDVIASPVVVNINTTYTPTAAIVADQTSICEGETITFSVEGNDLGNNPSFQWQINGINAGNNSPVFTTNTLSEGQNVTCTINTNHTCSTTNTINTNTITVNVTPVAVPAITITSDATVVCEGEAITFTATGDNFGDNPVFQWMINGNPIAENTSVFTTTINDNQTVTCQITNPDVCQSAASALSNEVAISVNHVEVDVLEVAFENCGNADGLIEIEGIGGTEPYSYEWMNGMEANLLTGLSYGKFSVTVTDANGCSAIGQIEMGKNDAPVISNTIINETDCEGDNGSAEIIMENTTMNYTIEWTDMNGVVVSNTQRATNLKTGNYNVMISNEFGCTTTSIITIEQVSSIQVSINNDFELVLGESFQLEAIVQSTDGVTYQWDAIDGLSCRTCPNPVVTPTQSTVFSVTVTNEYGCTATDEVFVKVKPNHDVFIPNAFTPNNDGINDFFTVFAGENVKSVKSMNLFDRWGTVLFNNNDFAPNVEFEGWNGTSNGKVLQSGVYVYTIEIEYIDGTTKLHRGDVSITSK